MTFCLQYLWRKKYLEHSSYYSVLIFRRFDLFLLFFQDITSCLHLPDVHGVLLLGLQQSLIHCYPQLHSRSLLTFLNEQDLSLVTETKLSCSAEIRKGVHCSVVRSSLLRSQNSATSCKMCHWTPQLLGQSCFQASKPTPTGGCRWFEEVARAEWKPPRCALKRSNTPATRGTGKQGTCGCISQCHTQCAA